MINKPLHSKGLNIKIPIIIPMKGRGGSLNRGLGYQESCMTLSTLNLGNQGTILYYGRAGFSIPTLHSRFQKDLSTNDATKGL